MKSTTERFVVGRVLQRLQECPYRAVRRLSCDFTAGVLTLRGNVDSFFHRQVALHSVFGVEEVQHIDDQIEVRLVEVVVDRGSAGRKWRSLVTRPEPAAAG